MTPSANSTPAEADRIEATPLGNFTGTSTLPPPRPRFNQREPWPFGPRGPGSGGPGVDSPANYVDSRLRDPAWYEPVANRGGLLSSLAAVAVLSILATAALVVATWYGR